MSVISNLIFNGANHYMTSPFGNRGSINTSAGATSTFHNGTDYGTNSKKIPQYAIEDGYVFAATKASDGALYVWVIYPRIKKAFLHYHLDTISVKAGQAVKKGTKLGTTGKTGKSTGIHLHLGIRDLKSLSMVKVEKMTWEALRTCAYVDPEKVSYTAPTATVNTTPVVTNTTTYKVGDVVNFVGNKHYTGSGATAIGKSCKPGKAKITAIKSGSKHPYHLVNVSGGGSTVYGWVNASDIGGAEVAYSPKVGDKVKLIKNAPMYGKSSKFSSWVYNCTLFVREVDGSRVVISTQKTGAITGAVDKKYLTKA